MRLTKKRKLLLFIAFSICVLFSSLFGAYLFQQHIIDERKKSVQTTLDLFYTQMIEKIGNMNYAEYLSYTIDHEDEPDLSLFKERAEDLRKENEHILFLAFIQGDVLKTILPEQEYHESIGKNISGLSYSYTLAKVVKETVVEGPEKLKTNQKDVFLFLYPLLHDEEYIGEIVAALDADYVIEQFGLDKLKKGNYDYELWTVNELGEHKNIIAVSDTSVDFSNALKKEFSLPANSNLSIQPKNGWISDEEWYQVEVICVGSGLLVMILIGLAYSYIKRLEELQRVSYTDPNCKLLNQNGFYHYINQRIHRDGTKGFVVIYIELKGYHEIQNISEQGEQTQYFAHVHEKIKDCFGNEVISARLNEETLAIAIYDEYHDEALTSLLDDFILQLFWKKKYKGEKLFIEPIHSIATYPMDGDTAASLIEAAKKRLQKNIE